MSRPAPLTPPEADLRPLPFMPLHVAKLRDSDLAAECDPEACWYALLLWCVSWHQLPAGSLPNNDAILTRLLGLGRDMATFQRHRAQAMRNWIECSDGRLYHPFVAEEVRKAWEGRQQQAWRTECGRIRKANQRNGTDLALPSYEEWQAGRQPVDNRAAQPPLPLPVPSDGAECPTGHDETSHGTTANVPLENPSKGQGERQGQGQGERQGDSNIHSAARDAAQPKPDPDPWNGDLLGETHALADLAGVSIVQPAKLTSAVDIVKLWRDAGIDPATVRQAITERVRDDPGSQRHSLRWFDAAVRKAHAARLAGVEAARPPTPEAIAAYRERAARFEQQRGAG